MSYDVIADLPNVFTNQQFIDAVAVSVHVLKLEQWAFLTRNGLDINRLAQARNERYHGPTIAALSNLTDSERSLLKAMMVNQLRQTKLGHGQITTPHPLNLHAQPDQNSAIIYTLTERLDVDVLFEDGPWFYIATQAGPAGYVDRLSIQAVQTLSAESKLMTRLELDEMDLEPDDPIVLMKGAGQGAQRLAKMWNQYGRLVHALANQLQIEPAAAMAVLGVESGGGGYGGDGRLKIRFENHLFYQEWGRHHEQLFHQHFTFDSSQAWKNHTWRSDSMQPYVQCHQNQNQEWAIFDFARKFDATAALRSISMGAPQVLGFNYKRAGYASVQEMFDAYQTDIRYQIMSLFNFIRADGGMVDALRRQDFYTFATGYNGPGQAQMYAELLQGWVNSYRILSIDPANIVFDSQSSFYLSQTLDALLLRDTLLQTADVFVDIKNI